MTTLLFTHPSSLRHVTPNGHPERVDRIKAINQILASEHFKDLARREAPRGRDEDILHAHAYEHLERIRAMAPTEGMDYLDPDPGMSVGTLFTLFVLPAVYELLARPDKAPQPAAAPGIA